VARNAEGLLAQELAAKQPAAEVEVEEELSDESAA
jgi:hypothetical protein